MQFLVRFPCYTCQGNCSETGSFPGLDRGPQRLIGQVQGNYPVKRRVSANFENASRERGGSTLQRDVVAKNETVVPLLAAENPTLNLAIAASTTFSMVRT